MRRTRWTLAPAALGLAAMLAGGFAQAAPEDEKGPSAGSPPEAKAEKSAAEVLRELQTGYSKARRDYYARMREAREKHGNDWPKHVGETAEQQFVPRYVKAAERFAGTEDAVSFLIQVAQLAPRAGKNDLAQSAVRTLRDKHAGSGKLSGLTYTLIRGDRTLGADLVNSTLERILATTNHDGVKSAMLYARGSRANRPNVSEAARTAAVADLRQAAELGKGTTYGERAASTIFELERLQIGMVAPDIAGNDLDGVAFKLSDYRGKVVVLDFWGDW